MPKIELIDFIWGGSGGYCSNRQPMATLFPLIRWAPHTQQLCSAAAKKALQLPSMRMTHTESRRLIMSWVKYGEPWSFYELILTMTWVRTILMSGAPERLTDRAGEGSTFREIRQLATWILWSLKSAASFILRDRIYKIGIKSFTIRKQCYPLIRIFVQYKIRVGCIWS